MKHLRTLARAFLSGIMIGVGGAAFLLTPEPMLGAFLFAVALFTIVVFGFSLFTGATGYVLDGKPRDIGNNIVNIVIIWLGNFVGCFASAMLLRWYGRIGELAEAVTVAKLARPFGYGFCTAILCGALMYIAVDNYRKNEHQFGKYLGILLCVPAFIMAGLEHSIADMFYLSAARGFDVFSREILVFLLVMTLGNLVGGLGFAKLRQFATKVD